MRGFGGFPSALLALAHGTPDPEFLPGPSMTQFTLCIYAVPWDKLSATLKHSRMAAATSLDRRRALPHGPFPGSLSKPSHTHN